MVASGGEPRKACAGTIIVAGELRTPKEAAEQAPAEAQADISAVQFVPPAVLLVLGAIACLV